MNLGLKFEQNSSFSDQMSDHMLELEKVFQGNIKHVDSCNLETVVKGVPFLVKEICRIQKLQFMLHKRNKST